MSDGNPKEKEKQTTRSEENEKDEIVDKRKKRKSNEDVKVEKQEKKENVDANEKKEKEWPQKDERVKEKNNASGNGTPRESRSARSPRSPRRGNKIYNTPPTPPPEELHTRERTFVLDGVAVQSTSNDFSKANPKLGQVIRPYNCQTDKAADPYFRFYGVERTLKQTGQIYPGTSMEGPVYDRYYEKQSTRGYLYLRNKQGAGHSREMIDGHGHFLTGIQPVRGYHGEFGYRRNTPWLRRQPSTFGINESFYPLY